MLALFFFILSHLSRLALSYNDRKGPDRGAQLKPFLILQKKIMEALRKFIQIISF